MERCLHPRKPVPRGDSKIVPSVRKPKPSVSSASDSLLATRIRAALRGVGTIREVKMFGGIAFMLNGNMAVAASNRGLLVRVGSDGLSDALSRPGARVMEMGGRTMKGYVFVDPAVVDGEALEQWLRTALAFVRTLPRKPAR